MSANPIARAATPADAITIVSGLPRSGTSMLTRMMAAGGIPVLTDGVRAADIDNPNGYFEYEPVKATRQDPSWVPLARGRAVKMVYRLLYDLPADEEYRILLLRRRIGEVLASQRKMLDRLGPAMPLVDEGVLAALYRREMAEVREWLDRQPHIRVLDVDYNEMLAGARRQAERIAAFLERPLDVGAMEAVVDPRLYRNRSERSAAVSGATEDTTP